MIITDRPLPFYRHKGTYRSNEARRIVADSWQAGHIDVQAITEPKGAGGYVMKELLKQAQCEQALAKHSKGEKLTAGETKRLRTLYWAKCYRRRLVSVSPKLSKLGELPSDEDAAEGAALFTNSNNPAKNPALIIPRVMFRAIFARHGRDPPRYTGERITHPEICAEIKAFAVAQQGKVRHDD